MKTLFHAIAIVSLLLLAVPSEAASAQAPSATIQRQSIVAERFHVTIARERITLRADQAPLEKLLQAIGQKSGIQFTTPVIADEIVSDEFSGLTLQAGLHRLLQHWNVAYYYSWRTDRLGKLPLARLSEVHVFGRWGGEMGADGTLVAMKCDGRKLTKILVPRDKEQDLEVALWAQRFRDSQSAQSRLQAATRLGKLATLESIELLSRVLVESRNASMRLAAVQGLEKSWSDDAIGPLSTALLQDEDSSVREAAARALGETWNEEAVPPLLTALLNDRDPVVREQAARALGKTGGGEAVEGLAWALARDRRWYVRDAAARALGSVGGREAGEAVAKAANDDRDRWLRETATVTALNMDHSVSVERPTSRLPLSAKCADLPVERSERSF